MVKRMYTFAYEREKIQHQLLAPEVFAQIEG